MTKKMMIIGCIFILCLNFVVYGQEMRPVTARKDAGYALLDKFIGLFRQMAITGTGGKEVADKAMEEVMAEAKQARAQKQLDPVFYRRFNRLLMVCKIAVDSEGILGPLFNKEVGEFVLDMYGELQEPLSPEKKMSVGLVAGAITEELLNLRFYLDTRERRAEVMNDLMKEWEKKSEKKK